MEEEMIERAAIIEYCGNLSREEAERLAGFVKPLGVIPSADPEVQRQIVELRKMGLMRDR